LIWEYAFYALSVLESSGIPTFSLITRKIVGSYSYVFALRTIGKRIITIFAKVPDSWKRQTSQTNFLGFNFAEWIGVSRTTEITTCSKRDSHGLSYFCFRNSGLWTSDLVTD
jgi:hypothetical protein